MIWSDWAAGSVRGRAAIVSVRYLGPIGRSVDRQFGRSSCVGGRAGCPGCGANAAFHRTLTGLADHGGAAAMAASPTGRTMQRLRLKADGRIVELRDGREFPLMPAAVPPPTVRDLRRRARLTQAEFARRLGVPLETIRNWEQGKRLPRGPARALLAVIAHAPDTVFAALGGADASA